MRFKHAAVLSLVLSVAACGQGGHDKGGKGHGGPGGGMPPAEVNVDHGGSRRRCRSTLRVPRPDRRLARGRGARARHRHPAEAQLHGRRPRCSRASRCSRSIRRRSRRRLARAEADVAAAEARLDAGAAQRRAPEAALRGEGGRARRNTTTRSPAEAIGAADVKAAQARLDGSAAQPRATPRSRRRSRASPAAR